MGPPRPRSPKKPGREGSERRPRPPEARHRRPRVGRDGKILGKVPRETVAVLFCWFRRLAVVGLGGREGCLGRRASRQLPLQP